MVDEDEESEEEWEEVDGEEVDEDVDMVVEMEEVGVSSDDVLSGYWELLDCLFCGKG